MQLDLRIVLRHGAVASLSPLSLLHYSVRRATGARARTCVAAAAVARSAVIADQPEQISSA